MTCCSYGTLLPCVVAAPLCWGALRGAVTAPTEWGGYRCRDGPNRVVLFQPFRDTTEEMMTAVNALLWMPGRPDGWLVFGAETYLTVATHLARRGIRVGEDISLICRNADPFFASMTPSVAHYRRDTRQFQRHLSQLSRGLVEHRALTVTRTLIPSTFEDGDSLRKAPCL